MIGLIAFWFLEVSSLIFIYMLSAIFCRGHMISAELLSQWIPFVDVLPFRYLGMRGRHYAGKDSSGKLPMSCSFRLFGLWCCLFLYRVAFHRGVQRLQFLWRVGWLTRGRRPERELICSSVRSTSTFPPSGRLRYFRRSHCSRHPELRGTTAVSSGAGQLDDERLQSRAASFIWIP